MDVDLFEDEELDIEIELRVRELARRNYLDYIQYVNNRYDAQDFHTVIADHLQRFAEGKIKRLMVTCPPQHGKSELSTRNLPPYLFGRNPNYRLGVLSFSASKAHKFSREIQQNIESDKYKVLFPDSRLATHKDVLAKRTEQEFDIVGKRGNLKAVGRNGPLTGDPLDIIILDDLFKGADEAKAPKIREKTWSDWIVPVVESRMHNKSQMLYVTTRWHEDDPAGRFLHRDGIYSKSNPNGWVLLNFAALRTKDVLSYDKRKEGEALWPAQHSKERMLTIKKDSSGTFEALYQGDPKPSEESVIFNDWIEIDEFPEVYDEHFVGLDFGYSNDPTAATHIAITGRIIYLDELFYETDLTNPDILDLYLLTGISPEVQVICDGAEPKSIEELKRGHYKPGGVKVPGINAKACVKGPGSINAGITKLKEYTVFYTKRSLNIKAEKNNYAWVMMGGKATNEPIGEWNHAIDGIRSAVFTQKSKPQGGTSRVKTYQAKSGRAY
ncbi:terminase large subunit domain-containing protein [Spirosoma agri]|uniref:Terminase n=1 Tax=Spirosoma agri TaxID=1987381 RepID=A0A6M0IJD1_9BACT|nr:terminase family protein [Spirosoma agri]NEU67937.1 terminase [Spirosoma agri]